MGGGEGGWVCVSFISFPFFLSFPPIRGLGSGLGGSDLALLSSFLLLEFVKIAKMLKRGVDVCMHVGLSWDGMGCLRSLTDCGGSDKVARGLDKIEKLGGG